MNNAPIVYSATTPHKAVVFIGACKFCGQTAIQTDYIDCTTQEEADERATSLCMCADALHLSNCAKAYDEAVEKINELFNAEDSATNHIPIISPDAVKGLCDIAHLIAFNHAKSVTAAITANTTVKLSGDSLGVAIERVEKRSFKLD